MRSLKMRNVDKGQPKGAACCWVALVAPVAAMMLLAAKPAWAGHWEEVPLPQPGTATYQAEVARRYEGTIAYDKSQGLWPNVVQYPTDEKDKVVDITTRPDSVWGSDSTSGGHLHLHFNVQRRSIFRWMPDYGNSVVDPPDEFLWLRTS